jgi:lysozyme
MRTDRLVEVLAVAALAACVPAQNEPELGSLSQGLQVCAGPDTVTGIDVSDWQKQIDWNQVAGAGYKFAIARINDGNHNDDYWAYNWSEMKRVGLIRGAYQFYEPSMDSAWQAQLVVNAVGALGDGDLPVTLDVEWPSYGGSPTVDGIQTWVDAVTAGTGKVPMIYTAVGYWDQYFSGQFGNLTLWVANSQVTCPHIPDSWSGWTYWQWGGGPVPGIGTGDVDQDLFNGKFSDLQYIANAPAGSFCSSSQLLGCGGFGCNCADGQCGGGFCPGTGCSAQSTGNCAYFGCGCVDGRCNGGYCPGPGCTVKETNDCAAYGCQCVDHQCNGGFCGGQGCTAKETTDCSAYGCQCVDHQCNGGFCPGQGCTAKEGVDCQNQGCGCVDHQCAGGSCAGTGCTAKEATDCQNAGQACSQGKCVDVVEPPDASVPAGPDAAALPGADASASAGPDAATEAPDADLPHPGADASSTQKRDASHPAGLDAEEPAASEDASAVAVDAGARPGTDAGAKLDAGVVPPAATSGGCSSAAGSPSLLGFLLALVGLARRARRG